MEDPDQRDPDAVESEPPPVPPEELVWSAGKTLLWSLVIAAAAFAAQTVAAIGIVIFHVATGRINDLNQEAFEQSGLILSLLTWFTLPCILGACYGFARMKRGLPPRHYLGLIWVPVRRWWVWILVLIGFVAAADFAVHLAGRDVVPEFMTNIYDSAGFIPLLWATLLVAAPLGEEVFFRGFIYRGLEYSQFGWLGATVVTAALWAFIHFQYDWVGVTVIFGAGLILGAVRHGTRSIIPCILLHSFMNLIATVELLLVR